MLSINIQPNSIRRRQIAPIVADSSTPRPTGRALGPPRRREEAKSRPPPRRIAVPHRIGQQFLRRLAGILGILLEGTFLLHLLEPRGLFGGAGAGGGSRCWSGLGGFEGVDRIGRADSADEVEVGRRSLGQPIPKDGRRRGGHTGGIACRRCVDRGGGGRRRVVIDVLWMGRCVPLGGS